MIQIVMVGMWTESKHTSQRTLAFAHCLFYPPSQTRKTSSDYNSWRRSIKRQKIYRHRSKLYERQTKGVLRLKLILGAANHSRQIKEKMRPRELNMLWQKKKSCSRFAVWLMNTETKRKQERIWRKITARCRFLVSFEIRLTPRAVACTHIQVHSMTHKYASSS